MSSVQSAPSDARWDAVSWAPDLSPVPCFSFPFSLLMVLHWATLADSVVLVHSRGSSLFKETPASKPILGYLHAFFHVKIAWPLYYGLLL